MSSAERALATTEAELARRSAARITAYLARRTDLSPACREIARSQREVYTFDVFVIEQALKADAEIRQRVSQLLSPSWLPVGIGQEAQS